jgi:hypothetical protein
MRALLRNLSNVLWWLFVGSVGPLIFTASVMAAPPTIRSAGWRRWAILAMGIGYYGALGWLGCRIARLACPKLRRSEVRWS